MAIVLREPENLVLDEVGLIELTESDVLVEVLYSGISTGTERLLWSGRMPHFPGLQYPLIPGYETVGIVREAGSTSGRELGEHVFVPGARCFKGISGLFGGAAHHLIAPGAKVIPVPASLGEDGVLLALAATASHALAGGALPDLIVGHGVLGRLLARLTVALGGKPTVWEKNPARMDGAEGYQVIDPASDARCDYASIYDVSGDGALLDTLIARLKRGGEIVLAGFYEAPLSFVFPPAFMREARLRIAAEFLPADLAAVMVLIEAGKLSLSGLISHRAAVSDAAKAYQTAFADPACVKMILDWRTCP
ncbi:MAG: chlorophyll synthesis pathway protein BchC [Bosea sp. (in: a-proteobacteria)]